MIKNYFVNPIKFSIPKYSRLLRYNLLIISFIFSSCSNNLEPETAAPIEVDIRMEVQILDSKYQLYSRPFTKIYFTSYKLDKDENKINLKQSDTTSCPNGWGVKLLNFTLNNDQERIILGAASEDFMGANYTEIIIDYFEAERRIDTLRHSNIIKTFAIYYK